MEHTITLEHTIPAATGVTLEEAWATWSDLPAFPEWDERERSNVLDGPLTAGTTGTFEQANGRRGAYLITEVQTEGADRGWVTTNPLPGGELVVSHHVTAIPEGVRLVKTYTATGPMSVAFRLWFAREIRREVPESLAALEREVLRRRTVRAV